MKLTGLSILIFLSVSAGAQHCPWDCAGMILIKTDAPARELYMMELILVEDSTRIFKNNSIVVDTNYGAGSYDTCYLKSYGDFMSYRIAKIRKYHGYAYDTVFRFAEGYFLIKFNWCKYKGKKLYIHFYDRHTRGQTDRYIEIPKENRIHLHDHSSEINAGKSKEILEAIKNKILYISCIGWTLYESDCK